MGNVIDFKGDIFKEAEKEVREERNKELKEKIKVKLRQIMDQNKILAHLEAEYELLRTEIEK